MRGHDRYQSRKTHDRHETRKRATACRHRPSGRAGPGEARAGAGLAGRINDAGGSMTSDILVTGGTGTLGRPVVRRLQEAGREVRVLSRRSREAGEGIEYVTGDLATGEGIEAAVDGAEIIVHCAGSNKGDEDKARNLVPSAAPTAPCSATSRPSWPPSGWWPIPACPGPRCAPPSSMT